MAASLDREELLAVDSQGAEIVTAGMSHFDLKSALTVELVIVSCTLWRTICMTLVHMLGNDLISASF